LRDRSSPDRDARTSRSTLSEIEDIKLWKIGAKSASECSRSTHG